MGEPGDNVDAGASSYGYVNRHAYQLVLCRPSQFS